MFLNLGLRRDVGFQREAMADRGELVPLVQDRIRTGFEDQIKACRRYTQTAQFKLEAEK